MIRSPRQAEARELVLLIGHVVVERVVLGPYTDHAPRGLIPEYSWRTDPRRGRVSRDPATTLAPVHDRSIRITE